MNKVPITQAKGYTVAWAAPEILQGGDEITREGDIFAFGMVVIEVGPRAFLIPQPETLIAHLTPKSCFRSLQEGFRSVVSDPSPLF